ncbi:MAG: oligopeptidase A, partial [Candidatus Competibacteraceae bacterium]|nr:oligopeptidase A [Candidatus Competibacteraceae bacterium]
LETLLQANTQYTWDNLVDPIEAMDDRLNKAFSPVSHLNAVMNNEALRAAYNACLPKLSDFHTEQGQNEALFQAYKQIADGPEYQRLDAAQRKVIDNTLRNFRLAGIGLSEDKKQRFKAVMQELSKLSSQFQDNVMDATQAWSKHIKDESALAGLPDSAKAMARQAAQQKELDGWLLTLEFPSYFAVVTY